MNDCPAIFMPLRGSTPIDISRPIVTGALVYPGDPPIRLERVASIGSTGPFQLTEMAGSVHMLTHLEAPAHFIPGALAIDQIPMERLVGPAWVVEADIDAIGPEILPPVAALAGWSVLFRTRHSRQGWGDAFDPAHAHLTVEAARALADAGACLVGIDYLDVERAGDASYPVHRALLGAGILILEGLDLAAVAPGRYRLAAFPLKLAGAEAAPCRAVLWPEPGAASDGAAGPRP
jgi:arylformamidase